MFVSASIAVTRWRGMSAAALVLLSLWAGTTQATVYQQRVGNAYDKANGQFLYSEKHLETVVDGEVVAAKVIYTDGHGETFATKQVDFSRSPLVPRFKLQNNRTGHIEALEESDGGLVVAFQRDKATALERKVMDAVPDFVADAGFDKAVDRYWDRLVAGESIEFDFLLPSQLDTLSLRVRAERTDQGQTLVVTMEPSSLLFRLLAPSIIARYDIETRQLRAYKGTSNLRNDEGKNYQVQIEFGPTTQVKP